MTKIKNYSKHLNKELKIMEMKTKRQVIQTKEPKAFRPMDILINEIETVVKTHDMRITLQGKKADEFIERVYSLIQKSDKPMETYTGYQENKVESRLKTVSLKLKETGYKTIKRGERLVAAAEQAEKQLQPSPTLRAYRLGEIKGDQINQKVL